MEKSYLTAVNFVLFAELRRKQRRLIKKTKSKANDMFKGKKLRVTGYVAEFSQAEGIVFSDSYYIYIDYGNAYDFNDISCYLRDSSVEKAIDLKKGDKVVIEGRCTGFSFSNVEMSSCDIIS